MAEDDLAVIHEREAIPVKTPKNPSQRAMYQAFGVILKHMLETSDFAANLPEGDIFVHTYTTRTGEIGVKLNSDLFKKWLPTLPASIKTI